MQFSYQEAAPKIFRPVIPVRLRYKEKFVLFEAIIDSGADYCIFDLGLIEILKAPLGRQVKFRSISGDMIEGFKSIVKLGIEESEINTEVIFSNALGPTSYGVLGQKGFFDNFRICFDKQKQIVDIEPKWESKQIL